MSFGYVTMSGGWCVEVWFKQNGPTTGRFPSMLVQYSQNRVGWGTLGTTRGRQLWFGLTPTGQVLGEVWDKDGVKRIEYISDDVTDNEWHHVAFNMLSDLRTLQVYLNGLLVSSIASSVDVVWDAGSMSIAGAYQPKQGTYGTYQWTGQLAYVAVKDLTLSGNQIFDHYSAGAGGTVYYGDDEVTRFNRILDWAKVPEQSRALDAPTTFLQGIEVTGNNALDKLQETANGAGGYVYADGQAQIVYHNRARRYNKTSIFTFSESLGTAVEIGLDFVIDDEWIYNDIRGSRPFGTSVRMIDQESIDTFGPKVYEISVPVTTHEEMRNRVGWLLSKYKFDKIRLNTVTIEAFTSEPMQAAATGLLDIGDVVTLDDLPDHAPLTTMSFVIEGITYNVDYKIPKWSVTFNLSPAEYEKVFEIGTSVLGGGDKVAY